MPPYTNGSPLGNFLGSIGQGLPQLMQQHRDLNIQNILLAQKQKEFDLAQQESQSKLAGEALTQKGQQAALDILPVQQAREQFGFENKVDPLTAWLDKATLSKAGVPDMGNYVPPELMNEIKTGAFKSNMLDSLMGNGGGQPAAAPGGAAPPAGDGGGAPSSSGVSMTPMMMMRTLGLYSGPQTPQEDAAAATARATAELHVKQDNGQIPQTQQEAINGYLQAYPMLMDAERALQDPEVQRGGVPGMAVNSFAYSNPLFKGAVSAKYAPIIPALDLSKQLLTKSLAGSIRNPQVRAQIQTHLADSDSSPAGALQRIQLLKKYMPALIRSQYEMSGAKVPQQILSTLGYTQPQWDAALAESDGGAAAANPANVAGAALGGASPVDAALTKYAQARGITLAQAQQLYSQIK